MFMGFGTFFSPSLIPFPPSLHPATAGPPLLVLIFTRYDCRYSALGQVWFAAECVCHGVRRECLGGLP